jgi:L-asparagine transporter-like permease
MEITTMTIIATLVIGGFLIFQDYVIPPAGVFNFSPQFWIGIALIIGAMIFFSILSMRKNKAKASNPKN